MDHLKGNGFSRLLVGTGRVKGVCERVLFGNCGALRLLQRFQERLNTAVPLGWLLGQSLEKRALNMGGNGRVIFSQRCGLVAVMFLQQRGTRRTSKGHLSCEQEIAQAAQGVLIALGTLHPMKLLRSHIQAVWNTLFERGLIVLNALQNTFHSELAQARVPRLVEKDGMRREVPVNDALLMEGMQPLTHLLDQLERLCERQRRGERLLETLME